MTVAYISHPDCKLHDMGPTHPESPARLDAIQDRLITSGRDALLRHVDAPLAEREHLLRVHDAAYVDEIFSSAPQTGMLRLDSDTAMNPHSLDAALRAAGACVHGVDLVMSGAFQSAFCAVRPPGHHAERARAMGFCIFNNVAAGAAHALVGHGLKRVAIADFDVHHGNGTEDMFGDDPRVLFCSSFQHPFYPWTDHESGASNIVRVRLPAGTGSAGFRRAIEEDWLPELDSFEPEFIFVSAGFDGHVEDPLAALALHESDYHWVTQKLMMLADRHAKGRIVSVLEGGYALDALGRCAVAHIDALLETTTAERKCL